MKNIMNSLSQTFLLILPRTLSLIVLTRVTEYNFVQNRL